MGIPTRGAFLAQRISQLVTGIEKKDVPVGTLDITLHRDDLRLNPIRPLVPTLTRLAALRARPSF